MPVPIRHGYKLRKLGSGKGNPKIPHAPESIEIKIRDPDGRLLFKWEPARGNIKQGLYECLDFTQKGLGINLDDVIEPQEKITKEKVTELNSATQAALCRLNARTI